MARHPHQARGNGAAPIHRSNALKTANFQPNNDRNSRCTPHCPFESVPYRQALIMHRLLEALAIPDAGTEPQHDITMKSSGLIAKDFDLKIGKGTSVLRVQPPSKRKSCCSWGFVYLDPASVANDLRIPQSTGVPQHSGPSNLEGQDQSHSSAKLSAIFFSGSGCSSSFRFPPKSTTYVP
ncbi:MAG: hypothetical protein Ct9H300mP8_07660 [Gammaproteobacteria bacterium]|nr:MAG: hypothetical protein Ct9H300mP8_07660 [Gammaproteobacteria bacterium]